MTTRSAERLSEIGEDELIRRLTSGLPLAPEVIAGAGDDCAILQSDKRGVWQLLKTDCVVEGNHFLRTSAPEQVGWKAMARVVSDIASMGGSPQHALVTLILPQELNVDYVEKLYAGLQKCGTQHGVSIVGGETTRGPLIVISVALSGTVAKKSCARRSEARQGDLIYVTGKLGGSLAGHHLTFQPRLAEAQWLCQQGFVHAMMDLSDGLASDLPRLARASGLGFELEESSLPVNVGCTPSQALTDGEDYELLFTLSPRRRSRLEHAWSQQFPSVPLTCIGRMTLRSDTPDFAAGGWDAFRSESAQP
jgi:thiamine-monophosphate kinase